MNDQSLFVKIEIVLDGDDGHISNMGVMHASGVPAFDAATLAAVRRAGPFGKPSPAIVSSDGRGYLNWEFHRDPVFACSTINARPLLLDVAVVEARASQSTDGGIAE